MGSAPEPLDQPAADRVARSRQIRHDAGVGFGAMCREAGLSPGYLSQLERGLSRPGGGARRWLAILAILDGWHAYPPPAGDLDRDTG